MIEFEAKFLNIDKEETRELLKQKGATLIRPEYGQRRFNFHLPKEKRSNDAWLRIRYEGDRNTLALKIITGSNIEDQKEIQLVIDSFDNAIKLLESIGCEKKAYQESKRELWKMNGVEITIDEWPGLEPFVEIEGQSEDEVRGCAEVLGFNYETALFSSVGRVYKLKYGVSLDEIEKDVGNITFDNKKLIALKKFREIATI